MARVIIDLPEKFQFSTNVEVHISNINYGGHLGNDGTLSMVHEARLRFLNKYDYTETQIEGIGLVVTDAALVYKTQVFHGDVITVEVAATNFNKYGCDFFFRLTNSETGIETARAKTGIVFYDYKTSKICEVPDNLKF